MFLVGFSWFLVVLVDFSIKKLALVVLGGFWCVFCGFLRFLIVLVCSWWLIFSYWWFWLILGGL